MFTFEKSQHPRGTTTMTVKLISRGCTTVNIAVTIQRGWKKPHLHLLPRIAKTRWPSGRAIINQQVIRYFSYLDIHDPLPHFLLAWFRNGRTITAATESNSIVCIPLGRKNVYRIKGSYPNTVIIVVKPFRVLKKSFTSSNTFYPIKILHFRFHGQKNSSSFSFTASNSSTSFIEFLNSILHTQQLEKIRQQSSQ